MLILLSPSKTQDFETLAPTDLFTEPHFEEERWLLKRKFPFDSKKDVMKIMHVSEQLAEENMTRVESWNKRHTQKNSKQAIHAFTGVVYEKFHGDSYSQKEYAYMQKHVRILSGLYGVIRPLDLIQPYRFEMGMKFGFIKKKENQTYKNLYDFWKPILTNYFKDQKDSNLIINLTSQEYSKAIVRKEFNPRWVNVDFLQQDGREYTQATVYTKQARGSLAHWMVKNHIKSLVDMKKFSEDGYKFSQSKSTDNTLVFVRKHPNPS